MTCPHCGAAMRLESGAVTWVCEFCRAQNTPAPGLGGLAFLDPSKETCPVCVDPLHHATLLGERLLACPRCKGMLVDMEIFMSLASRLRVLAGTEPAAPVRPAAGELERRLRCPSCANPMDTHYYGGPGAIVIDSCSSCEVDWLDAGELQRVAAAHDAPV